MPINYCARLACQNTILRQPPAITTGNSFYCQLAGANGKNRHLFPLLFWESLKIRASVKARKPFRLNWRNLGRNFYTKRLFSNPLTGAAKRHGYGPLLLWRFRSKNFLIANLKRSRRYFCFWRVPVPEPCSEDEYDYNDISST